MMQLSEKSNELQWCIHYMMRCAQYEFHLDDFTSIETLIMCLEHQGFMVDKYNIFQKKVQEHALPGLLTTNTGGHAVLVGWDSKRFWVEYPRFGRASFPFELFEDYFEVTIYVLTHHKTYDFKKGLIQQFLKFAWKRWFRSPWLGGLILFCVVLYEGLSLIEPLFLNLLIQHVSVVSSLKDMALGGAFLGLILIMGLALGFYRHRLWVYFFGQCAFDVTDKMFRQYLGNALSVLSCQNTHDVYTRLCALEQMSYRLLQQFFYIFLELIFIVLHGWVMFYCQSTLAMVDMIFLILMGSVHYFGMQHSFEQSKQVQVKQQNALALLMENMTSIVQIKLLQAEVIFFNRWRQQAMNYWQDFLKNENKMLQIEWWMTVIKKSNWLLSLVWASYFLNQHQLTLGILIAYLSVKALVFGKAESLFKRLLQWQYIKAPLYRIQQIFLEFKEKDKEKLIHDSQDIILKNIEIHGRSLKDIHFSFGKKYILAGASGCGKSTLFKMLMGVLPQTGEIYYPKNQQIYRDMVFVQQEEMIWDTNLVNNITVFEQMYDLDRINHVLDIVGMTSWQTSLNDEPLYLSGGQKQRVLIARALYRQPKWLILDESTCHLDEASEQELIRKLSLLPISIVMVNHRQETYEYFDEVIEWGDLARCLQ